MALIKEQDIYAVEKMNFANIGPRKTEEKIQDIICKYVDFSKTAYVKGEAPNRQWTNFPHEFVLSVEEEKIANAARMAEEEKKFSQEVTRRMENEELNLLRKELAEMRDLMKVKTPPKKQEA